MYDSFIDVANAVAQHLAKDFSALTFLLAFIGCEILFDKIEKRYAGVKRIKYVLRLFFVINLILFLLEYVEFQTGIPVKIELVNRLNLH